MNRFISGIKKYSVIGVFLILFLIFSLSIRSFLSVGNLQNIIIQSSLLAVLALGLNFVMMVGEIDLSFSGSVPLLASIFVILINDYTNVIYAFFAILLANLLISFVNALLVSRLKLNSFITTTAVMFLLTGLWYIVSGGKNIWISGSFDREYIYGYLGPIPKVGIILIAVFIIVVLISEHTRLGMAMRAVSSDPEAAKSSGINIFVVKTIGFVVAGIIFSISTVLSVARLSGALASAGTEVMLPTMTIAYVGQSILGLGRPNMWGILIGAVMLGMVNNAFTLLNLPTWAVPMAYGVILMLSIALSNIGETRIKQVKI